MNDLFVFAGHNTLVAIVLALFVHGLTRRRRNPPLSHVLWLLVLLKLVAPPVVCFDWSAIRAPASTSAPGQLVADEVQIEVRQAENRSRNVVQPTALTTAEASAASAKQFDLATGVPLNWDRWRLILLWIWLCGAGLCAMVAATRIVLFERLLRDTLPASERLQRLTLEIASKIGVRRVPDVRYVECVDVPLLWCAGRRPTIVLPMPLLRQLDDQQAALILAHELAHLRRCDHWARAVELIVSTVYWWNPLVWVIRRQIHEAEDLCCDAWVRWAFPDCTRRYADVLLKAAESLGASHRCARLLPASPFLRSLSLKARIEMILDSRFTPRVSTRSRFVIALFALLVLPSFVETTKTEARADSNDEAAAAPAGKPETQATSQFPHVVKFEQGATHFADGDKITILEVRGTADTFTPGNIYCVKGTYTLASRDRAILLASTTVTDPGIISAHVREYRLRSDYFTPGFGRDPGNATGDELKVQRLDANRGAGTFRLFLPFTYGGFPHVSFCSLEKGGATFGGNYFGTGDSVLKRWWNTDEKRAAPATNPDTPTTSDFPYVVKYEQGKTQFLDGDKITILEIHGTADTMTPGNIYWIKGTYTLASHEQATLAASTTAREARDGIGPWHKCQTTVANRGDGTFTLFFPMSCEGWPHLSFYAGESFGGIYFGTGDSLMK